ncbi:hypothetical protein E2C01_036496 [Portunus trituberculatus]|uniref:Uncharacterized protein n=1 Tax=Portunus trituberculatus TaxID=210409 RepID=A0A5B7FBJ0_PORTR|nr:hypothetical protein [Portunus trituberculatus]
MVMLGFPLASRALVTLYRDLQKHQQQHSYITTIIIIIIIIIIPSITIRNPTIGQANSYKNK